MRIVSVVNMKGGVGKSTTVCMMSEALSCHMGLRVLVVDLDPQSNASMMLAGLDRWSNLQQSERTLDAYFNQFIHGTEPRRFSEFVAARVTDIDTAPPLDLVMATPEFRYAERDALDKFVGQGFMVRNIHDRLARLMSSAIESVAANYDLVVFDCPPGISLFAEAAIAMSEYVIIPTIPDYVSRLGIFAFRRRAVRAMEQRRFTEDRIFTVITKYEPHSALHQSEVMRLQAEFKTFDTIIPQNEAIARAGAWSRNARTFDQKYGDAAPIVRQMAVEFQEKVGLV